MKDLMIKLIILTILAAVLCAGFIYLDNIIVANAQDSCFDDCMCRCLAPDDICAHGCGIQCPITYNPALPEMGPYPAPIIEPTPYPAPLPFAFPVWLQVILDSITAFWL